MKGIDSARTLARQRAYAQESVNRLKKSYDEDKKRLEKSHKQTEHKQRTNYMESKEKLDSEYSSKINELQGKTQAKYDRIKKNFNQIAENNKENDTAARQLANEKFRESLTNLRKDYKDILTKEKAIHESQMNNAENRYKDSMTAARNKFAEDYRASKNISARKISDIKDKSNQAIRHTKKVAHEKQLESDRVHNKKRSADLRTKDQVIDELKTVYDSNLNEMRARNKHTVQTIKDQRDKSMSDLTGRFIEKSKGQRKAYLDEKDKLNDIQKDAISDIHRKNFQDNQLLKKRLMMSEYGNEKKERYKTDIAKHKDSKFAENMDRMNKDVERFRNETTKKSERARKAYLNNLKKSRSSASNERMTIQKEMTDKITNLKDNYRKEKAYTNKIRRSELESAFTDYDTQLRNYKNKTSATQMKNLNKLDLKVKQFMKRNSEAVEDIRDHYEDKNKTIIFNKEAEKNKLVKNLREEFQRRLEDTNSRFVDKLLKKDVDADKIVYDYENRIDSLNKKIVNDSKRSDKLFREKHKADREMAVSMLKIKDKMFEEKVKSLKNHYEQKIFGLINKNERILKRTRKRLSEELTDQRMQSQKEKDRIARAHKKEMAFFRQHATADRAQIVRQFQDKIKRLRSEFQYQIDKIRDETRSKK